MKHIIAVLTGLLIGLGAQAQQASAPRCTLEGYGLYDTRMATGSNGGGALTLTWHAAPNLNLSAGAEYASLGRIALNVQGQAALLKRSSGMLYVTDRYLWRHYPGLNLQEFTSAALLGWRSRHCDVQLGLCNRYIAELVQRAHGGQNTVLEPMNIMFAVEASLFDRQHPWNVSLRWSDYSDFVIERFANWFYSVKGYFQLPHDVRFIAEAGIHPAGSLNLTSSYDGWFFHLGAQRKF